MLNLVVRKETPRLYKVNHQINPYGTISKSLAEPEELMSTKEFREVYLEIHNLYH
jgi:hypothetical protein